VVVFQHNTRIFLVAVFDDVIQCLQTFWETRVTHVAPKHLGPWALKVEAAPLPIIVPTAVRVTRAVLEPCALVPSVGMTARRGLRTPVLMARPIVGWNKGSEGRGPPHGVLCGSLLPAGLRVTWDRDRNLSPALKGALHLLCIGDAEDVFQLTVHLVHPVGGGCVQFVPKCNRGHVLASPNRDGARRPLTVYGVGDVACPSLGVGHINHYSLLWFERGHAVV
jgi:hypothetical protein